MARRAGGGYELALAADHIMLIDDGSSSVSLPELPLLAVLPGTGGLTRVTDKRKVRRDLADVFCTTEEGVKGKRAVDWRLVDEVVPNTQLEEAVKKRAREFAARSDRPTARRRHRARSAHRQELAGRRRIFRALGRVLAQPAARARHRARTRCAAAGEQSAPCWRKARNSGRCGSRASSTTPCSTSGSTNSTPPRSCSIVRRSKPVLAYDAFLEANKAHWLVREIRLFWKRVLKRVDLTSRTLVDFGRARLGLCRHLGRARLRQRPLLHADRPARRRQPSAADACARRRSISAPIR